MLTDTSTSRRSRFSVVASGPGMASSAVTLGSDPRHR